MITVGAEALTSIKDVESAHWIDVDDDVSSSSYLGIGRCTEGGR